MKKTKRLPKISIITPSYNQGEYIGQTIRSVLDQNYPNLQYLVIDGGSTDNTLRILKSYGKKIEWISEKDNGQSDAINKGLKMAKGDIVSYLNSDDILLPNALRIVSEYFMNNQKVLWLTGYCSIIDHEGKETRGIISKWKSLWLYMHEKVINNRNILLIFNYIAQPSTFLKKEVIDIVGNFDENLCYTMDYDYWLRLSLNYKLNIVRKELSSFRLQKKSKSVSNVKKSFEESYLVASRYTSSKLFLKLHKIHDMLAIFSYKLFNN